MSEAASTLRQAVVSRALEGPGTASRDARRSAFENTNVAPHLAPLIDKVARRAWTVTDGDVAAASAAGASDDELFELAVCAALGQATRQLERSLASLTKAEQERS